MKQKAPDVAARKSTSSAAPVREKGSQVPGFVSEVERSQRDKAFCLMLAARNEWDVPLLTLSSSFSPPFDALSVTLNHQAKAAVDTLDSLLTLLWDRS